MAQGEWYEENGRLYHNWHRGLYMYPLDEVRTFLSLHAIIVVAHINAARTGADGCVSQPLVQNSWTSSTWTAVKTGIAQQTTHHGRWMWNWPLGCFDSRVCHVASCSHWNDDADMVTLSEYPQAEVNATRLNCVTLTHLCRC